MIAKSTIRELPEHLREPLMKMQFIVNSYLAGLGFIHMDTSRSPSYNDNHLLTYLVEDLLQSTVSLLTLATEGLVNVARREVRFILEATIKLCYVQQKEYHLSIREKIEKFDAELKSQRISVNRELDLHLLPEEWRQIFIEECGRIYGLTSSYVHLTPTQLNERIAAVDGGRTSGNESQEDLEDLNLLVARGLAASLVLLFHSVPKYVAGDFLVDPNGDAPEWYFSGSRFIAAIDSEFDYKHERQSQLQELQALRSSKVFF
ncbi:hypothetical protein [Rhizobium leguminosarum]|uniref:hypothetical protein n=1 Tax=Rhizobium leguminosarum TaxID=384 RepID=UPI001C97D196|nr:hypothetical protein [Rhizobium leguminosarum]MBY5711849.1 hypothetical protein [Rhizobium leguminosarum]